ncbi:hypothetical protein QBC38DRAFT_478438 [Podospora fimiseda]|uniref:Uncharacterized protein n=1 Tax=Podospora fimiseda TaxID=252190 RepID=A0AAN7GUA8_9PEZI|nr:hypothetical protein QBC38DRAFT_478438 [Podospora fimiseda]
MKPLSLFFLLLAATTSKADITVLPGGKPLPYKPPTSQILSTASDFLRASAPFEFLPPNPQNASSLQPPRLLLSTYSGTLDPSTASTNFSSLSPSSDSFIRGAIQAWGEHLHLEIRPEEVWFTVLTQLNFYMQTHAESIRHLFVPHQGKETIFIEDETWTRVLLRFKDEIQNRVKTPWLSEFILPNFTTTTQNDIMTANILMMGLMKSYFRYEGGIICGLPSVTLLGTKQDWSKLQEKLNYLPQFGAEPAAYKTRLDPIFKRFVSTFDEPDSPETIKFWNSIVFASHSQICGAAPLDVSGWITGFIYWDDQGKPWERPTEATPAVYTLDGIKYTSHDITRLPLGYARAPFIMRDFDGQARFPAFVAAGNLGKKIVKGWPAGYKAALKRVGQVLTSRGREEEHGTLRPLSAWMLYGPGDHESTAVRNSRPSDAELANLAVRARANLFGACAKPSL